MARRKDCEGYRWLLEYGDDMLEPIRDHCLKTNDMLEARILAEAATDILMNVGFIAERSVPPHWEGEHEKVVAYTLGLIQGYLH